MPHTPGPWSESGQSSSYIDIAGPWFDAYEVGVPTAKPGELARQTVCRVHGQINGEANAKLIAAAPDMLAALQLISDRADAMIADIKAMGSEASSEGMADIAIIKAAIKKATE